MKKYNILGFSTATVSMLLEIILRIHKNAAEVDIIENMKSEESALFKVPEINIKRNNVEGLEKSELNNVVLGVYRAETKIKVYNYFKEVLGKNNLHFCNLIHPNNEIASTVSLGSGIMIQPNSVIAPFANIENFVTINRSTSIGHHTIIGPFSTINPGAHIAGNCQIGSGVTIGMGCNIIDKIKIGENSIIGAGSVVTRDVPSNVLAYGIPAKIVRKL